MYCELWLKISASKSRSYTTTWHKSGAKISTKKPATGPNEIAFKLKVDIPDSYFERPAMTVALQIPDPVPEEPLVSPEVTDEIAQQISESLGIKVHLISGEAG